MAKKKDAEGGALTLTLEQDKETKGAVRYSDGEGKNLYFRKEELDEHFGGRPESLTVTVTANE